jgi:putative holliday junction resolvase
MPRPAAPGPALGPATPGPAAPAPVALAPTAPKDPTHRTPRVVLAFDFGQRRIGVACGDTVSRSAAPLDAVPVNAGGPRWELIDALLREWQPALAVVGLPYNVDGSDSAMTQAARQFAAELERRCRLPVVLVDERYSSREAEARLKSARASGLRRRRVAKADVDAAAACVILERWFTEET